MSGGDVTAREAARNRAEFVRSLNLTSDLRPRDWAELADALAKDTLALLAELEAAEARTTQLLKIVQGVIADAATIPLPDSPEQVDEALRELLARTQTAEALVAQLRDAIRACIGDAEGQEAASQHTMLQLTRGQVQLLVAALSLGDEPEGDA